ncbi:MAG: radical SAM protein [Bacteroidaceae bacterium]|nr:radical SAM protein [Bacteroidaceae bacterium]
MATITYSSPIFGPVRSRRFGISLGINLMPGDGKICTFDCIYCECGLNGDHRPHLPRPTAGEVRNALERQLQKMSGEAQLPDVLTFAGNGEPTAHPQFAEIIDDTVSLRDKYCPQCKINVLSNATMLHKKEVVDALKKVDNNCQKLDTVDNDYIFRLDRPQNPSYNVLTVIEQLKQFNGRVVIQTMFLTGEHNGRSLDNTTEDHIAPWLEALKVIAPQKVMIYTIDRDTPIPTIAKAPKATLDAIAARVRAAGTDCTVSY